MAAIMVNRQINLKYFSFQALLTSTGLKELDALFLQKLYQFSPQLHAQLIDYRQNEKLSWDTHHSQLVMDLAVFLENFMAELFRIELEVESLQKETISHSPIFAFKAHYVMRLARRAAEKLDLSFETLDQWVDAELKKQGFDSPDRQLGIARLGLFYLNDTTRFQAETNQLVTWCIAALRTIPGKSMVGDWEMFRLPKPTQPDRLVSTTEIEFDTIQRLQGVSSRYREGFGLTDQRMNKRQVMAEINYCVYCHKNQGDFCSRGFPIKKNDENKELKKNFSGEVLTGCPLEEKISEMHVVKKAGFGIGALAIVMVDNPLCPLTGHRICNDCMKSCIYQKQEPVNIPETETHILTDVLNLPWGVEIYDLLTRWNPLRQQQWAMKPYNGLKVLVMGMGPAGISLSHYLLMEGFAVAGADGLKLEPLPERWLAEPIHRYQDLVENLSDRLVSGFGGVAEYGITSRWDKNFLKLVYISLMRRPYFQTFGSIRFGGTLTVEDTWRLGFDHLALAVGAGLPKELSIPNSLAPGMRQASDFLMALQLTGATKFNSLTPLQVRLPAVVIGGGLTCVDTATEVQAYYLLQIENFAKKFQILSAQFGEVAVRSSFSEEDQSIVDEFLNHAQQLATERLDAQREKREPNLIKLIRQWGGVTIVYRRTMQESPAYRRNHEELIKALEEGVFYAEKLAPQAITLDAQGYVLALQCESADGKKHVLPSRSIFVATGARLNVAYEFEHRDTFKRRDSFEYQRYQNINGELQPIYENGHVKSPEFGAFTSYQKDHYRVSFLGDTHPIFHGSVVKAMASAKRIYPEICALLAPRINHRALSEYTSFREKLSKQFGAKIENITRHNSKVIELSVRAPIPASKAGSGQFYRVQNYESYSPEINQTRMQMEGLALMGVPSRQDPELLSFFIVEENPSSRLIHRLKIGDPISVMGPTGAMNDVLTDSSNLLIIGDLSSIPFILSMAEQFIEGKHHVNVILSLENAADLYAKTHLQAIAQSIVWITQHGLVKGEREADKSICHNGIPLDGLLKEISISEKIQQIWLIGSSSLLKTFQKAEAAGWMVNVPVKASVYGPMQCMLKGVCAQCLQWQIDPITKKRTKAVYACSWQHQPFEKIDLQHLDERSVQNRCHETLNKLWMDYLESPNQMK